MQVIIASQRTFMFLESLSDLAAAVSHIASAHTHARSHHLRAYKLFCMHRLMLLEQDEPTSVWHYANLVSMERQVGL